MYTSKAYDLGRGERVDLGKTEKAKGHNGEVFDFPGPTSYTLPNQNLAYIPTKQVDDEMNILDDPASAQKGFSIGLGYKTAKER